MIYFETEDAGALFRFTDMYPRMFGGQMWVAMDPPTQEQKPQVGTLSIPQFRRARRIDARPRGRRRAGPAARQRAVHRMHVDFTRSAGKMSIRDGVVRGPAVGATVEGQIDYIKNDAHLRGTFVPLYGLNNMFGQIPIVGMFLGGGSNEGLLGVTYEASRPAECAAHHRQSDRRDRAWAVAQVLRRRPGAFDPNCPPAVRALRRGGALITPASAARGASCRARA